MRDPRTDRFARRSCFGPVVAGRAVTVFHETGGSYAESDPGLKGDRRPTSVIAESAIAESAIAELAIAESDELMIPSDDKSQDSLLNEAQQDRVQSVPDAPDYPAPDLGEGDLSPASVPAPERPEQPDLSEPTTPDAGPDAGPSSNEPIKPKRGWFGLRRRGGARTRKASASAPARGEPAVACEPALPADRRSSAGRRRHDRIRRYLFIASIALAVVLILLLMRRMSMILAPFALAFLGAYLMAPVVNAFHRLMRNRTLAVGVSTVLTLAAVGSAGWLLFPVMAQQVHRFASDSNLVYLEVRHVARQLREVDDVGGLAGMGLANAPDGFADLAGRSETGIPEFRKVWQAFLADPQMGRVEAIIRAHQATAGTYIGGALDELFDFAMVRRWNAMINAFIERIVENGSGGVLFVVGGAFAMGFLLVAMSYLLLFLEDAPEVTQVWHNFLADEQRSALTRFAGEFHQAMGQYLVRQFVTAVATGVLYVLAFGYLGLPMALPLGVFVGLLSLIPYLQLAGIVPAALLAVFHAFSTRTEVGPLLLGVAASFVIVSLVQELVYRPLIVGRGRGFERATLLIGVFLWPTLLGWTGVVFVIPFSCALIAWIRMRSAAGSPQPDRAEPRAPRAAPPLTPTPDPVLVGSATS